MSPKTFIEGSKDGLTDPSTVKTATIRSITHLFDIKENVVVSAYGNKNTDTAAYMDAGISTNRIYLVNSDSILRRMNDGKESSYPEHARNVNQLYPKIN